MLAPIRLRVSLADITKYVTKWCKNRQAIFAGDGDMKAYYSFI
jgi:hypothetical protein